MVLIGMVKNSTKGTVTAEIMFPCIVRTSRTSNEVGSKFVRSWLELRTKLARSSFELGRSSYEVGLKLGRSSFEVGSKFIRS